MEGQPGPILQFLPLVVLFAVFYFLIIRPQRKTQKEHASMIAKLDKNDEVITVGGIHGTIVGVTDKTVSLRVADNVKIEVDRSCIQQLLKSRQS